MPDTHRLQIVIGSTRPDRAADHLVPWIVGRAREHARFDVEVLDLRDWPLPMFQETIATLGDINDPTYSDPIVRAWNDKVAEADGYLFVTPEYNHSVPGVLKNAIDNVFFSFALRNKPAGLVGYSVGPIGGARAVEHLAHIAIEAELVPLRNTVLVGGVGSAFREDSTPVDALTDAALGITIDDLAWWSDALTRARAEGQLVPGTFRLQAARVAAAAAS